MTQYELPDGFEGMETAPPAHEYITCIDARGWPQVVHSSLANEDARFVGWAPIVPLKAKARFVVCDNCFYGPWAVYDTLKQMYKADNIPTESAAQRIADIYNEVMP